VKGLQGKKALVTGGSSGIGQAIAIRLGEEGVDVAINYVGRPDGAEETRDAIEHGVQLCMKQMSAAGTKPILVAADVSDPGQVARMFDEVEAEYGGIDILINNAGIQVGADTHRLHVADFDKVLAVNLRGAFLCAQRAIQSWLQVGRGGCIVNVSSVHQLIPSRGLWAIRGSVSVSDEAAYITGQTVFVDGGLTLYPSFETTWSSE
jgi:glucose 1-dehydrogenase